MISSTRLVSSSWMRAMALFFCPQPSTSNWYRALLATSTRHLDYWRNCPSTSLNYHLRLGFLPYVIDLLEDTCQPSTNSCSGTPNSTVTTTTAATTATTTITITTSSTTRLPPCATNGHSNVGRLTVRSHCDADGFHVVGDGNNVAVVIQDGGPAEVLGI